MLGVLHLEIRIFISKTFLGTQHYNQSTDLMQKPIDDIKMQDVKQKMGYNPNIAL